MANKELWTFTIFLVMISRAGASPELCNRGFQIAAKFHNCWEQGSSKKPFPQLRDPNAMWSPELLEKYATHMCSVVKPIALECLRNEVNHCYNSHKLMEMADSSGGACHENKLNPFFKQHIINLLKPVSGNSPCFQKQEDAYKCYEMAARDVLASGITHVDIGQFHRVADKFFDSIWTCHIKLYKKSANICPDWQMPMLISLQTTAMPSLFGMKLNNHQVAMLELGLPDGDKNTVAPPTGKKTEDCADKQMTSYVIMRVINDKSEIKPGDVVMNLYTGGDKKPALSVNEDTNHNEVTTFVKNIINAKGGIDMRALKKFMKEEQGRIRENKKKQREMKLFISQIRDKSNQNKKTKRAKKQRN